MLCIGLKQKVWVKVCLVTYNIKTWVISRKKKKSVILNYSHHTADAAERPNSIIEYFAIWFRTSKWGYCAFSPESPYYQKNCFSCKLKIDSEENNILICMNDSPHASGITYKDI